MSLVLENDTILLLGKTGGGKSSVGNKMLGNNHFPEGNTLKSETKDISIVSGSWLGRKVTVIDTPGFLDSNNEGTQMLINLVNFLGNIPPNKLKMVILTIPLGDTRADSSFTQILEQVALILGEECWRNVVFLTTGRNVLNDVEERISFWKTHLTSHKMLQNKSLKFSDFNYDDPNSLRETFNFFCQFPYFLPKTSSDIQLYIESNPSATVWEVISKVESLNSLSELYKNKIKTELNEISAAKQRLDEIEKKSERMVQSIDQYNQQITQLSSRFDELQTLQNAAPQTVVHGQPPDHSLDIAVVSTLGTVATAFISSGACSIM